MTFRLHSGFFLAVLLSAFALGGAAILRGPPPAAIDIAATRITSAIAEGVAIALTDAPQDQRGLTMLGTLLDDAMIKTIQQSPAASRDFVDRVSARYPISEDTKGYLTRALIGFSQICEDFPPPPGSAVDSNLLKLIVALRHGVENGIERHHSARAA
jgi:hypothetical protein